jgi:hypothetical protein
MRMTLKARLRGISSMLCGWCGYFDQGPIITIYDLIHRYTERRIRRWLLRRSGRKGTGFDQIPDEYIFMRRSASTPSRETAATCQERRFDGTGESRMREIRTSGLTSGDWKRGHGPN